MKESIISIWFVVALVLVCSIEFEQFQYELLLFANFIGSVIALIRLDKKKEACA